MTEPIPGHHLWVRMTEPISAHHLWAQRHTLGSIIPDLPDLPNAACKGKANLWDNWIDTDGQREDESQRAQRHHAAIRICDHCPELYECRLQREAHPEWGEGIWGGQLYERTNRTCKRCGKRFTAKTNRAYCTDTCRDAALKERLATEHEQRRAQAQLPRLDHCQGCNKTLEPGQKRNCSTRCRKRTSEQRARAAA